MTYYGILALFPAALVLLSLLGIFGQDQASVELIVSLLDKVGASSIANTIEPTLIELSMAPRAGLTLVIGLLAGLWTASSFVGAFGRGLNRIYEVEEDRPIWKLRLLMLGLTIITVSASAVIVLSLILTGPAARAVGEAVGLGETAVTTWNYLKWPFVLLLVVLVVALLYHLAPNTKPTGFRWFSPGSVVAIATWLIASGGFGFYIANFANYDRTYGSLAGIIIFLLWLWLTNLALLFGAQLDAELARGRAHGGPTGRKLPVQ